MFENILDFSTLSALLQNPAFIAAVFALIRNLGGYLYNSIEARKFLPYDWAAFGVTLGLWETVFIILSGGAGLSPQTTAVIAIILDWLRGLKTAIPQAPKPTSTDQAPPASPKGP